MGVSSFLTGIIKMPFLFFWFSSPSSPHVSCTAAAAAMRTMEKKGRAAYVYHSSSLFPYFEATLKVGQCVTGWLKPFSRCQEGSWKISLWWGKSCLKKQPILLHFKYPGRRSRHRSPFNKTCLEASPAGTSKAEYFYRGHQPCKSTTVTFFMTHLWKIHLGLECLCYQLQSIWGCKIKC